MWGLQNQNKIQKLIFHYFFVLVTIECCIASICSVLNINWFRMGFFFSGHVFSFKSSGGTIYLLVHFVLWAKQCQFHRTDVKKLVFSDMRLLNFSTLAAVLSQTTQRYHHPLWHHKGLIPRTVFTMQCQWEEVDIVSKEWKNEFSSNIGALGLNLQKQCKGCRPSNCFSFSKSNVQSFYFYLFIFFLAVKC